MTTAPPSGQAEPQPTVGITPHKKVAIVGFASSSRDQAPFGDPDFAIWTMNHAPLSWIPRWDVLFELHTLDHLKRVAAHSTQPMEYLEWLARQPGPDAPGYRPIYMQESFPAYPASIALPRKELNEWFAALAHNVAGYFAEDYYTSTVSFMLALAIMQYTPEIHLYGVDLLQDDEYGYQRPGAEYLIGLARGMGIKVYVPPQSALCKANYTYGFSEPAVEFAAGKSALQPLIDYIEDKAGATEKLVDKARQDAATLNGAIQMADLVLGWLAGKDTDGKDLPTLARAKRDELQKRFQGAHDGALTMSGQGEAFKTCAVWGKHFARGGALNP